MFEAPQSSEVPHYTDGVNKAREQADFADFLASPKSRIHTRGMETQVLLSGLRFGEGPRWRDGLLWFSDFYRRGVYTVDETGVENLAEILAYGTAVKVSPAG